MDGTLPKEDEEKLRNIRITEIAHRANIAENLVDLRKMSPQKTKKLLAKYEWLEIVLKTEDLKEIHYKTSIPSQWEALSIEQKEHLQSLMPTDMVKSRKLLHLVQDETGWSIDDCEAVVDYLLAVADSSHMV